MLTVKQLMDEGLTEDQAKKVVELHKKDIDGNFEPKERNQELRAQVNQLKEDLKERDKSIDELKTSAGASEELKKTIETLQADIKTRDKESEQKISRLQKEYAIKAELVGKVHDVDVALSLLDVDKITLDEGGKIKSGFKEQFDQLAKDKAYLIVKAPDKKAPGFKMFGNPPEESDEGGAKKDEPQGVAFAKAAAERRKAAGVSSSKAADAYFGGNH